MKKVEETVHVPAKTYVRTKYVASDGEEFYSEDQCLRHERNLEIDNHPVFKTRISNVEIFNTDYMGTLYYLTSGKDYNFFVETMQIRKNKLDENFSKYGAGWYLYWFVDGDYFCDEYYLYNYDAYTNEIKSEFAKWEEDMRSKMNGVNNGD